jgi:hypothetical protein
MGLKKIQIVLIQFVILITIQVAFCEVKEELHKTYPLPENGQISLENLNGDVFVNAWDKKEIQVDAIKSAKTNEGLSRAEIVIDAQSNSIEIETKYRRHEDWDDHDGASVEYHLTVPRHSNLDTLRLVNGHLEIHGVRGQISASCVNGKLTADGLANNTKINAVNGSVMLSFESLNEVRDVVVSSVNGRIEVAVPANASAEVRANTLSGQIHNDFNLETEKSGFIGKRLEGTIGSGGRSIKLSNVNGSITLSRL